MSDVILFYKPEKEYGCFSNWYECCFTFLGVEYISSEQYMMHQKAIMFGDEVVAKKILQESDQLTLKRLGREVSNYDENRWNSARTQIMRRGLRAKFSQNKELMEVLFSTNDAILGEASPRDKIWGIGKGMGKAECYDPSNWKGQNLLGKTLMLVRDDLRSWIRVKGEIHIVDTQNKTFGLWKKKVREVRDDPKYKEIIINYLFSLSDKYRMKITRLVEMTFEEVEIEFRKNGEYRMLLALKQDLYEMANFLE